MISMKNNPSNIAVAIRAAEMVQQEVMEIDSKIAVKDTTYPYSVIDCQAFVEACVNDSGGNMSYAGSNDMARNGVVWLGTLNNAIAEGKLVPGAGVMIHEDDETDLPKKYQGDGLGDFNHVGIYLGDDFVVQDYAKGKKYKRTCDIAHSSSSMERVAGSTVQNGWTHVVWFKDIDYGIEVTPGVTLGADISGDVSTAYDETGNETVAAPEVGTFETVQATVYADNGKPVKIRAKPSTDCDIYWLRSVGTVLDVLEKGDTWCKVKSRSRVGYMMTKFLQFS